MTDVRQAIRSKLNETGKSMEWLSLKLGKNPSYIQQFLERGSPRDLSLELKIKTTELLDMPLANLGVTDLQVQRLNGITAPPTGMAEDAVPYALPPGSILSPSETISYYQMKSNVLENHPLRIVVGDIIAFDMSPAALEQLKSEQVVIAQCYHPDPQVLLARTIVREFVRPGILMTNRTTNNEAFAIDDASLPFEAAIKGVLRTVVRHPS